MTAAFVQAMSVDEALDELAAGARPIAGGTDLVVAARAHHRSLPPRLVAIDRIDELRAISVDGDHLRIGAAVSHAEVVSHPDVRRHLAALGDAAALVGSPATRHVGTLGGNIMNASPAADTSAPLLTANAIVEAARSAGRRQVPIGELWTGPGTTILASDELCTAVLVPLVGERTGSAYLRLEYRRAMEIAVVGAAATVTLDDTGAVSELAVGLTAVAPTVIGLDPSLLGDARGRSPAEAGEVVNAIAADAANPITDSRASDRYRRAMVGVIAKRAIEVACRRASGESVPIPANRFCGIGIADSAAGITAGSNEGTL